MHDHPHIEILKFWQPFLNLLDGDWPASVVVEFPAAKLDDPTWPMLEGHFRSVQHLAFDEWWEHCHLYFAQERGTPVQQITSVEDLRRYRDEEAEADNLQVTVTLNLWHTRAEINAALEAILDGLQLAKTGNPHRGWDTVECYHIFTSVDVEALEDILYVLRQVKNGKRNVEIQSDMSSAYSDVSAASVSKLRKKGFTILEHLRMGNFPKIS